MNSVIGVKATVAVMEGSVVLTPEISVIAAAVTATHACAVLSTCVSQRSMLRPQTTTQTKQKTRKTKTKNPLLSFRADFRATNIEQENRFAWTGSCAPTKRLERRVEISPPINLHETLLQEETTHPSKTHSAPVLENCYTTLYICHILCTSIDIYRYTPMYTCIYMQHIDVITTVLKCQTEKAFSQGKGLDAITYENNQPD